MQPLARRVVEHQTRLDCLWPLPVRHLGADSPNALHLLDPFTGGGDSFATSPPGALTRLRETSDRFSLPRAKIDHKNVPEYFLSSGRRSVSGTPHRGTPTGGRSLLSFALHVHEACA